MAPAQIQKKEPPAGLNVRYMANVKTSSVKAIAKARKVTMIALPEAVSKPGLVSWAGMRR